MDHREAPLLDALATYDQQDRYGFTPPGHRQGRAAGPRTGRFDMGLSDHARIEGTFSMADDDKTAARLLAALARLTDAAPALPDPRAGPAARCVGPRARLRCPASRRLLRAGPQRRRPAGMVPPDPADPSLDTIRVCA